MRLRGLALAFSLAGLACLSLIGCASSGSLKLAQGAYLAANVADLHSTHQAHQAGAVEGNPLIGDTWLTWTLAKTAGTVGVWWLGTQAEKRGHQQVAVVITTVVTVVTAIVSGRNYSIAWR